MTVRAMGARISEPTPILTPAQAGVERGSAAALRANMSEPPSPMKITVEGGRRDACSMTKLNLKQMEPRDAESEAPQRREGERGERNVVLANIEGVERRFVHNCR